MRSNKELPCQNCLFIEMGEMACYQETCPDCGRVPPSRTREIKKYRENLEVLRGEVIHKCLSFRYSETIIAN